MTSQRKEDLPDEQSEHSNVTDTPERADDTGIVDGGERDAGERPRADPEVPELGAWDQRRRQLPDKDATGF